MKTRHEQLARMICHAKTTVEHVVMDSCFHIRVLNILSYIQFSDEPEVGKLDMNRL